MIRVLIAVKFFLKLNTYPTVLRFVDQRSTGFLGLSLSSSYIKNKTVIKGYF